MTNEELGAYIKNGLGSGYTREAIKTTLVQAGWNAEQVEEGFKNFPPEPANAPSPRPFFVFLLGLLLALLSIATTFISSNLLAWTSASLIVLFYVLAGATTQPTNKATLRALLLYCMTGALILLGTFLAIVTLSHSHEYRSIALYVTQAFPFYIFAIPGFLIGLGLARLPLARSRRFITFSWLFVIILTLGVWGWYILKITPRGFIEAEQNYLSTLTELNTLPVVTAEQLIPGEADSARGIYLKQLDLTISVNAPHEGIYGVSAVLYEETQPNQWRQVTQAAIEDKTRPTPSGKTTYYVDHLSKGTNTLDARFPLDAVIQSTDTIPGDISYLSKDGPYKVEVQLNGLSFSTEQRAAMVSQGSSLALGSSRPILPSSWLKQGIYSHLFYTDILYTTKTYSLTDFGSSVPYSYSGQPVTWVSIGDKEGELDNFAVADGSGFLFTWESASADYCLATGDPILDLNGSAWGQSGKLPISGQVDLANKTAADAHPKTLTITLQCYTKDNVPTQDINLGHSSSQITPVD